MWYIIFCQRDASTLQRLQNMGIKTILKADRLTSTISIHEELNIRYLSTRRDINSATEMYKVDQGLAPPAVCSMFRKCANDEGKITRQTTQGEYLVPRCRLEYGRRNFRHRGPNIWAQVPPTHRTAPNVKTFKANLRKAWSGKFLNSIM